MGDPSPQVANGSALESILSSLDAADKAEFQGDQDDVPLEEAPDTDVGLRSGTKKFEGAEHRTIGDNVTLYDINGRPTSEKTSDYVIQKIGMFGIELTYGRIISMAGDFYTNRKPESAGGLSYGYAPICGAYYDHKPSDTAATRFRDMVAAMLDNDYNYMFPLKRSLDKEKATVDASMGPDGGNEARAYHSGNDMDGDAWFTSMTAAGYPKMAWLNADHFGNDALLCYKVGHALACQAAVEAGVETDNSKRANGLKRAYFIEATSNHYLTDLFSSGHLRVPRRAFHYDNYDVMKIVGIAGLGGFLPVWDAMCRVMHDDDSAIGLLCSNAAGEQWIAFGDKQLFMPANGSNRLRCVYTVQKSIDEVLWYFQNPKESGQKREVTADTPFKTLELIPTILKNSRADGTLWATSLMDNPAPLWVPDANKVSKDQKWTYRSQNDNHAAYTLEPGRPGFESETWDSWSARSECTNIYAASFRKDDQFPKTQAVAAGVGLLQISQTGSTWSNPASLQDWVCATTWYPIVAKVNYNPKIPRSITVRTRQLLEDQFLNEGSRTPLVHSFGWFNGSKTTVVIMRHPLSELKTPNKLMASAISFTDPKQGQADQFDLTPGVKQSAVIRETIWKDRALFVQPINASISMMDLRCVKFTDGSLPRPILVSIICDDATIYYGRTYLDDGSSLNTSLTVDAWSKKDVAADPDWPIRPFIKGWKMESKKRRVLFCQHSAIANNKFKFRVGALQITDDNGNEEFQWQQKHISYYGDLRTPGSRPYNQVRSSCFLVGDMLGTSKWPLEQAGQQTNQVATVTISPTYTQFDIAGWREGSPAHIECMHDCADNLNAGPENKPYQGQGYLRDYFIALIPSQFGSGAGLDVLHVSLHKTNSKYYLKFKTHINDRSTRSGATVSGRAKDYFGSCNINWIQDDFMSKDRYESGRYQSLKWLYMPHADANQKNAVMEIFSWYGIIGFRYFAAKWDGKKYEYNLVGVQPYNGQTSGTVGRGFYGTWGEGFVPVSKEDFIDVNYYNMVLGGEAGHGYWDSANKDSKKWNDPGFQGSPIRRESDYVRGLPGDMTKLEN